MSPSARTTPLAIATNAAITSTRSARGTGLSIGTERCSHHSRRPRRPIGGFGDHPARISSPPTGGGKTLPLRGEKTCTVTHSRRLPSRAPTQIQDAQYLVVGWRSKRQSTQEANSSGKRTGEVVRQVWPELMRVPTAIRRDVKVDAAGHELVQDFVDVARPAGSPRAGPARCRRQLGAAVRGDATRRRPVQNHGNRELVSDKGLLPIRVFAVGGQRARRVTTSYRRRLRRMPSMCRAMGRIPDRPLYRAS